MVHHINHIQSDNNIKNLIIVPILEPKSKGYKERKSISDKRYRQTYPETMINWRIRNRKKIQEYGKLYGQSPRGIRVHKIWVKSPRGIQSTKAHNLNRRLQTKDLDVEKVKQVYDNNIKQFGTLTCYLCFNPIEFKKDHLEHKIPLSRGGTNKIENLNISCKHCNWSKGNKTEEEYRKEKKTHV